MQFLTYQISGQSDQNCGRDSATVFPTNMAAVTSLIMIMSQNTIIHTHKLQSIEIENVIYIALI